MLSPAIHWDEFLMRFAFSQYAIETVAIYKFYKSQHVRKGFQYSAKNWNEISIVRSLFSITLKKNETCIGNKKG